MTTQIEELIKLPATERILLAEALWDSLEDENSSSWVISEKWKTEIDKRYNLYKEGKTELFTWEEVKQKLLNQK
ncbi:MAG: addiction module protein [Chitinophagales bacterium]|nr:addiction module protein [Chitinophagales bacterium]